MLLKTTSYALLLCAALALGCQRERPDAIVNAAVVARLEREPALATTTLEARTENGHVVLSGEVTSPEQRRIAEHVTEDVRGVKSVTNQIQIQVGSGSTMPESEVAPPAQREPPPEPLTPAPQQPEQRPSS